MSQLIRFEDKFGMTDIVCIVQDLGLQNPNDMWVTHSTMKKDILVQYGLSIGLVLNPDDMLKTAIMNYDINEIIYVFDMDALDGKGIMPVRVLKEKVNRIDAWITSIGKDIIVKYAPVVWSAETIALYILLALYPEKPCVKRGNKGIDITNVVHFKNTMKFHGRLLEDILKNMYSSDVDINVKHLRDYIGKKEFIIDRLTKFIEVYPENINVQLLKWIMSGETKFLYDSSTVIEHQEDVAALFDTFLPRDKEIFISFSRELSLNKKCW